jgi:hypothetical protein
MHEAPAFIYWLMIEQPLNRPSAAPGDAIVDFLHLLGDVQVQWCARRERHERGQLLRRDGAQTMRRDADAGAIQRLNRAPARF